MHLVLDVESLYFLSDIRRSRMRLLILTTRWPWMSFGTWPWVKGQSQNRSDTGRTPAADCEGNWPAAQGRSLDWPGTPEDCGPQTAHSQHQN